MVTSPETLHSGLPTSLAVTALVDFPGRVVAELAHGNTKVVQTEEFQGGDVAHMFISMLFILTFHFKR